MSAPIRGHRPAGGAPAVVPPSAARPGRAGIVRLAVAVTVGLASAAAPEVAGAQTELVEQGNLEYQDGDFAAAIEAYERVLDAGFVSADLRYNLGNAYFKSGELGRAILEWERARVLAPGDPDVAANLELARSLTADVVEPLPEFWLLSAWSWWVDLLPRGALIAVVAMAWLLAAGAIVTRILARRERTAARARTVIAVAGLATLVLGLNLALRETGLGRAERAVVLAPVVPVRSAPAEDDNLTLFQLHEGTVVRVDQRAGGWAEVVLLDGKVGWVPVEVFEVI